MTQLYDREREMKLYVKEREQEAANDATRKSTLENIRNLMETMKWEKLISRGYECYEDCTQRPENLSPHAQKRMSI